MLTTEQKARLREHYLNQISCGVESALRWEREEQHVYLLNFQMGDGYRVLQACLLGRDGMATAQLTYRDESEDQIERYIQELVAHCWKSAEGHIIEDTTEEQRDAPHP